jgi:dihydrofolate reductase
MFMAELTLNTFLTLDGVMQAPGGPNEDRSCNFAHGGWLIPHADNNMGRIIVDIFSKADAFLLGRTTYDIFSAYWPRVTSAEDPIATKLNSLPKYVASRTRSLFSWSKTTLVRDVIKEVVTLKDRFAREVQVHGSCGLAQTLIENDLIDEYRLLIFPVILGNGKRLFGTGAVPTSLTLVKSNTTSKGAIASVYRRGGSLKTARLHSMEMSICLLL